MTDERRTKRTSIGRRLWFVPLALSVLGMLAGAAGPAQSAFPGGNGRIAFTNVHDVLVAPAELYVMEADGSSPTRLTTSPAGAFFVEDPAWSPDATKIAFSQAFGLNVLDVATSVITQLTNPSVSDADDVEPAWSPDGSKLAFARRFTGSEGIWSVNADGSGGPVRLTESADSEPAWSPDGGTIAFTRSSFIQGAPNDIYVMNADGGGEERVTMRGDARDPSWSPDGRRLAFVTELFATGSTDIATLDLDTDVDTEFEGGGLTVAPEPDVSPSWSPDGTKVVFERFSGNREIHTVEVATGDETRVSPIGLLGERRSPDWARVPVPPATPTCWVGSARVDEGGPGVTSVAKFEIQCENPDPVAASVSYATSDGTALPNDYTASSGSFMAVPGPSHHSISVDVTGDDRPETHETIVLTLTSTQATLLRPTATATIVDDDQFSIEVTTTDVAEGDTGSTDVELTVSLNAVPDHPFTARVITRSVGSGLDFEPLFSSALLSFAAGEQDKTISYRIFGDVELEEDQKIDVTAVSRVIGDANTRGGGILIRDDEAGALSIDDVSVAEGDAGVSTATFTVVRSTTAGTPSFSFSTQAGTATEGDDFVARSGTVSFNAGVPVATVSVDVSGDLVDEPDETFQVLLSSPVGATIADGVGAGTIVDDDPATLSVGDVTLGEGGGTATVVVTRTSATDAVAFDFVTETGTATEGDDYSGTGGRVSFLAGQLTASIPVTIADDALDEPDEAFGMRISNPENAAISDNLGLVTIADDDAEPTLSIDDVSVLEGDAGTVKARFTVSLSAPSGKTVRVRYATADGTATAPRDYTAVAPTELVLSPLTPAVLVEVDIHSDTDAEGNETFRVELSGADNATVADGEATGTIVDDEPPATLSIADVTMTEGDAGTRTATFTVTRSHTVGDVSFRFLTEDGSATPLADYFPNGGTVSFATGAPTETFTVEIAGDVLDEDDETFGVRLSNPVEAVIADGFALGTIVDDDASPSLSIDDVSVREGNAGHTVARFTVTLSAASAKTVTVVAATADGTATASGDYTAVAPTTLTFTGTTTQTLDVTVNGDGDSESDETFTVLLSGALNATVADGQGVGTIRDDDSGPTVSISDAFVNEADAGPSGTVALRFTVSLSHPSEDEVTVDYETVNSGASAPFDYNQIVTTKLRFPPGTTSQTLDVTILGDREVEDDERFVVELSGATSATIADPFGVGIILTDEGPPSDAFAAALPLGLTPTNYAILSGTSVEAGEPGLTSGPTNRSVWFRLSPGRDALNLRATLEPFFPGEQPSPQALQLSIYRGDALDALTLVARTRSSNFPNNPPLNAVLELAFFTDDSSPPAAGYYLQLVVVSNTSEPFHFGTRGTLTKTVYSVPENDDFAQARTFGAGQTAFDTSFATGQAGEPGLFFLPRPGLVFAPSVWFRVDGGGGGHAFHVEGNPTFAGGFQVSVYSGSSLGALALVKRTSTPFFPNSAPGASVDVAVPAGPGSYYVQLVGPKVCGNCTSFPPISGNPYTFEPGIGAGTITHDVHQRPANDDLSQAHTLGHFESVPLDTVFDTSFATVEAAEPNPSSFPIPSAVPSVWFRFQAPGGTRGGLALRAQGREPIGAQAVPRALELSAIPDLLSALSLPG